MRSQLMALLAGAGVLCAVGAAGAQPTITLRVGDAVVDATAGPISGSVDVFFEVEGEGEAPQLAGYDFVADLVSDDSGLAFASPFFANTDPAGAHPPIFPNDDPSDPPSMSGADRILATAFHSGSPDPAITDQAGLLRILFEVEQGTLGVFNISIDTEGQFFTTLNDPNIQPIEFTAADGQITVIPEPASLGLLGVGGLLLMRRRR